MIFKDPWVLIAVLLLLPLVLFYKRGLRKFPGVRFSSGEFLKVLRTSYKIPLYKNIIFLRAAALLFIIVSLARPQGPLEESVVETEGIDIVLAIDTSTSMLAEDFAAGGIRQNRLDAVKDVVKGFINKRSNDRIGLVAFAAKAYTVCPLTLDYGWLLQNLNRVKIGMIKDGTAIGSGLSSALNRLKETEAKSKIVILLTDGRNNAGKISPAVAAEAASALNIKVYTIGAGTRGYARFPAKDMFGRTVYQKVRIEIDEDILKDIAAKTKARYYRATDAESLREIYKEIDTLEKTPVEEKGYMQYRELFPSFLSYGIILLFLEIIVSNTILRRVP